MKGSRRRALAHYYSFTEIEAIYKKGKVEMPARFLLAAESQHDAAKTWKPARARVAMRGDHAFLESRWVPARHDLTPRGLGTISLPYSACPRPPFLPLHERNGSV